MPSPCKSLFVLGPLILTGGCGSRAELGQEGIPGDVIPDGASPDAGHAAPLEPRDEAGHGDARAASDATDAVSGIHDADAPLEDVLAIPTLVSGTRLRAEYLGTSEGAKQPLAFWDTRRGEACAFEPVIGGTILCVPRSTVSTEVIRNPDDTFRDGNVYADETCTTLLVEGDSTPCAAAPKYLYVGQYASCTGVSWALYPVAKSLKPSIVYQWDSRGHCQGKGARPETPYWRIGERIDPAALVEGTAVELDTPGRLKPQVYVGSDGARQVRGWFDSELAMACAFGKADDGKMRCLPDVTVTGNYFGDRACQMAVGFLFWSCRKGPALYASRVVSQDQCNVSSAIYKVGAQVPPGTEITDDSSNGCYPSGFSTSSDSTAYYLRESMPGSQFEELNTVWLGAGRLQEERHANREGVSIAANVDPPYIYPGRFKDEIFNDTKRGTYCSFMLAADATWRCVPPAFVDRNTADWGLFGDTKCTVPLADPTAFPCDPVIPGVVRKAGDTCTSGATFYEALDYDPSKEPYFVFDPINGCRATTPSAGFMTRKLGNPIDPGVFAEASDVTE
jgi:hypothetical protein